MRDAALQPKRGMSPGTRGLLTLALAGAMGAGIWAFNSSLVSLPVEGPAADVADSSTAPWPTVPATIVPADTTASSPAIVPTVAMPRWEEHLDLTVVEFTLTSVQTAGEEEAKLFGLNGQDQVTLRVTGKMRASIDLAQMRPGDIKRDGNTISLALPHVQLGGLPDVTGIEILGSQQRMIGSEYAGLETQAIALARSEIYQQVEANPGLQQMAEDAAVRRLTQFLIEVAGFRDVTITFR